MRHERKSGHRPVSAPDAGSEENLQPRSRSTSYGASGSSPSNLPELVDEVLAAAAHEFKTPLAIVRAQAQLIQRRSSIDSKSISTITRQVDRLTHLVQQCLEFSRLGLGLGDVGAGTSEIAEVVEVAVNRARASAPKRTITVTAKDTARIRGDPERLAHAVSSLIDNALRYSGELAPVEVSIRRCGDEVRVSIRDEGAGIPTELRALVEEPIVEALHRTDPGRGGIGIGLRVCMHIVRAHGGELLFSKNEGPGSTFTVVLPAADHDAPFASQPRHVLVVEDDPDVLEVLEYVLGSAGFRVRTAHDGEEALVCVAEEMPGLILLDMRMPRMDGWSFAREFDRLYGRACPIVVVTAGESAYARACEIGANGWLAKPFELEEVVRVAERWVGSSPDPGAGP